MTLKKTDAEHNRELLTSIFELARKIMHEARGSQYGIAYAYYVDEEEIVKAAREGARAGMRDALDALRGCKVGR